MTLMTKAYKEREKGRVIKLTVDSVHSASVVNVAGVFIIGIAGQNGECPMVMRSDATRCGHHTVRHRHISYHFE